MRESEADKMVAETTKPPGLRVAREGVIEAKPDVAIHDVIRYASAHRANGVIVNGRVYALRPAPEMVR